MTKIATFIAAAALSASAIAPAAAGWDRSQVIDPAFSRSYDRQLEAASAVETAAPVVAASAVATNDAASGSKAYFGPQQDRAVDSMDSPYDN